MAYNCFSKAAEQGDKDAWYALGNYYQEVRDFEKAISSYEKAADKLQDQALFRLGELYMKGQGVERRDIDKAIETWKKAEKLGNKRASLRLRKIKEQYYDEGKAREKNGYYNEAYEYYSKAVKLGSQAALEALLDLGNIYLYHLTSNDENRSMAYKCFSKAVELEKEDKDAWYALGNYYQEVRDFEKAISSYEKAADKLQDQALFRLGELYMKGQGVERRDIGKAKETWKKAEKLGNKQASLRLRKITVFIAHPWSEGKSKWSELKEFLERYNYKVFEDSDSELAPDINFCIGKIDLSKMIIVLVGNHYPFGKDEGVFYQEMKHLSDGIADGKLLYICSYGTKDPLDKAVRVFPEQTHLQNLLENKNHNFNYEDMKCLAECLDKAFMDAVANEL